MARGFTDDAHYQNIAAAIREKNGQSDTYAPSEMADAILAIESGTELDPLGNPATAQKIFEGYEAYNDKGEPIIGEALPALSNPATGQQILSGYEAYDSHGNPLSGTAFLTSGTAEFTLEAAKWVGTTYTLTTNAWRAETGQTPLMDLPFTSSAVNAQRVVEAGITMPRLITSSSTADDGTVTYTTTIVFSAVRTPPVDVDIAVFNITAVAATANVEGEDGV